MFFHSDGKYYEETRPVTYRCPRKINLKISEYFQQHTTNTDTAATRGVLLKKAVLKNFVIITGKQPC